MDSLQKQCGKVQHSNLFSFSTFYYKIPNLKFQVFLFPSNEAAILVLMLVITHTSLYFLSFLQSSHPSLFPPIQATAPKICYCFKTSTKTCLLYRQTYEKTQDTNYLWQFTHCPLYFFLQQSIAEIVFCSTSRPESIPNE